MLTSAQLKQIFPGCKTPDVWVTALTPALDRYQINNKGRIACFLAQTGHESGGFNRLVETPRFTSTRRLMEVWPSRFPTEASAAPYVNNPQALANLVYSKRLGNGSEASGDGYRYRGRGLIQLTGRSNYEEAKKALGIDVVANPELLEQPANAAMSAAWFWASRGLNALADDETGDDDLADFTKITKIINGGTIGLQERLALLNRIYPLL